VLQVDFALLQSAPGLLQAFSTRQKSLHLQLEFDALSPEEFAPLCLGISRSLAILVWLLALSLIVVVSLIATGLLLIGHEKPPLSWRWLSSSAQANTQHKNRQNQPLTRLLDWTPPFCCIATAQP
jgi:hypothetical protein